MKARRFNFAGNETIEDLIKLIEKIYQKSITYEDFENDTKSFLRSALDANINDLHDYIFFDWLNFSSWKFDTAQKKFKDDLYFFKVSLVLKKLPNGEYKYPETLNRFLDDIKYYLTENDLALTLANNEFYKEVKDKKFFLKVCKILLDEGLLEIDLSHLNRGLLRELEKKDIDIEQIKILLEFGATPTHEFSKWGRDRTIFEDFFYSYSLHNKIETDKYLAIVRLLVDTAVAVDKENFINNCVNSLFQDAVRWNLLQTAGILLGLGADINAYNICGDTPLTYECRYTSKGAVERVEYLLQRNANPNLAVVQTEYSKQKHLVSYTAAHLAVRKAEVGILKLLIKYKADLTLTNALGHTALHTPDLYNKCTCLQALQDADIEVPNTDISKIDANKIIATVNFERLLLNMTGKTQHSHGEEEYKHVYVFEKESNQSTCVGGCFDFAPPPFY